MCAICRFSSAILQATALGKIHLLPEFLPYRADMGKFEKTTISDIENKIFSLVSRNISFWSKFLCSGKKV
jgi:hypothetical protein